jgi:hypothetical protein
LQKEIIIGIECFSFLVYWFRFEIRTTSVCEKTSIISYEYTKKCLHKRFIFVVLDMQHTTGIPRQDLQMSSLEDKIGTENPIRFIDAFVEHISLGSIGFTTQTIKSEGRPSPACRQAGMILETFLKSIYTVTQMAFAVRELRSILRLLIKSNKKVGVKLEKECIRNIELQWLLEDIRPNYHIISNFLTVQRY